MLLKRLQELLGGIYDVHVDHDVCDFLVTDREQLPAGARAGYAQEELLVAPVAAGELALSLYLDPALLRRLAAADPLERLHGGNVADCLTALEGVSHFLYLVWNASHDRPVSLLELEMQAEVDKFIVSHTLLRRQVPGHFPLELRRVLFERAGIDPRVGARAGLYREASGYAGRFCRYLERSLVRTRREAGSPPAARGALLAELRRFYRFSNAAKRAHIEQMA
jgi:hypothetical protein